MQTPVLRSWKGCIRTSGSRTCVELVCVSGDVAVDHQVTGANAYVRAFKSGKTSAWGFGNILELKSIAFAMTIRSHRTKTGRATSSRSMGTERFLSADIQPAAKRPA